MLSNILLASLLATSAFAAPTLSSGSTGRVVVVPNPSYIKNGPRALTKALKKFKLDRHFPSALRRRQQMGEDPAHSIAEDGEDDIEYLSPVNIGGQVMNLQFDTGSSDLWVYSTLIPTVQTNGHKDLYHPSATFKQLYNTTWGIQYADLSYANGNVVGTDVVSVGGVTFDKQVVELATNISTAFTQDTYSDGLLGLAFDSINTVKPVQAKTFSSNVLPSLKKGVFTADLKHQLDGSFDFGYIDQNKYKGKIAYTDLRTYQGHHVDWQGKNIFWEFDAGYYVLDHHRYPTSQNNSVSGIADTGTTLLLVTNDIAEAYYKTVKGATFDGVNAGGYIFPCNATLPDIGLAVGQKHHATIKGSTLNFGYADTTNTTCFGALQGNDGNMMIYGDIFFKNYFSVFDLENKQFGFARKQ